MLRVRFLTMMTVLTVTVGAEVWKPLEAQVDGPQGISYTQAQADAGAEVVLHHVRELSPHELSGIG